MQFQSNAFISHILNQIVMPTRPLHRNSRILTDPLATCLVYLIGEVRSSCVVISVFIANWLVDQAILSLLNRHVTLPSGQWHCSQRHRSTPLEGKGEGYANAPDVL